LSTMLTSALSARSFGPSAGGAGTLDQRASSSAFDSPSASPFLQPVADAIAIAQNSAACLRRFIDSTHAECRCPGPHNLPLPILPVPVPVPVPVPLPLPDPADLDP